MLTSTHDGPNNEDSIGDDNRCAPTKKLKERVHAKRSNKASGGVNRSNIAGDLVLVRCVDTEVALERFLADGGTDEG